MVLFNRASPQVLSRNLQAKGAFLLGPRQEYIELKEFDVVELDGTPLLGSDVPQNKSVMLAARFQSIISKCRVYVVVNQGLSLLGTVSCPQHIYESGERCLPFVTIRTTKAVSLSDLPWLFRLYVELK